MYHIIIYIMELRWENINIVNTKTNTQLLNNSSGVLYEGEILVLVGPSGAGKSLLLNSLSKKVDNKLLKTTGNIYINNSLIDSTYNSLVSYVHQDDILESQLTPLELLFYTAKLKLNRPLKEIEQIVAEIIKTLKLEDCKSTLIGDTQDRGISGGERKRTSIALELINDSPIIFLDEPTTGLDSSNAYDLINLLKRLCLRKKIIILTLHSPSSEIFDLIDKIYILANSSTIYFGSKIGLMNYFDKILKKPFPIEYNPFEHILETVSMSAIEDSYFMDDVLSKDKDKDNPKDKNVIYRNYINVLSERYIHTTQSEHTDRDDEAKTLYKISKEKRKSLKSNDKLIERSVGFFYCLWIVTLKNLIVTYRNKRQFKLRLFQHIISTISGSLLFNNLSHGANSITSREGLLFMFATHPTLNSVSSIVFICKKFYINIYLSSHRR